MADTRYRIPSFVAAKTPMGLRRAMLLNNAKRSTEFKYHDIQFVGGQWYAWFHDEVTASQTNEELIGTTEQPRG